MYVVKSVSSADVTEGSNLGAIKAYVCGDNVVDRDLYFKYKGRDGVTHSDLIPLNQITYMKYVSADSQKTPLKKVEVTLDSAYLVESAPIVGQDYILNIVFQQFYGLSPEDTYVKTVPLHITSAIDSASKFYKEMKKALEAAFAREIGASASANPYLTFSLDNDSTATKLIIEEKEQPYSLGKGEPDSLVFDVVCSTVYSGGDEVVWGEAKTVASTSFVKNNKKMADLEWFTFSERADYYHGAGWPNDFTFVPMVDATGSVDSDGYDALEIHFAYQGTCEDIQKSEKDITLIASAASSGTILKSLAEQIESVTGGKVNDGQSITKVATPVATPGAGSGLSGTVNVSLSCATPGAKIYYTTNGNAPTSASTEFTGTEISMTSDTTIKAIAIKDGMSNSDVLSALYDFT